MPGRVEVAEESPCSATAMRKATRRMTQLYDDALAPAALRSTQYAILEDATGRVHRSKTASVLEAVATTAPEASATAPSVKAIREPTLTTVPVAVSSPLPSRTALR